jgi:hypothetical protein
MESVEERVEQRKAIKGIAHDRRVDRRYDLKLELCWNLMRGQRVIARGTGTSVNLSSGGILFDAGRTLPLGFNVELFISWPVLLHDTVPLQLTVSGRILRISGTCAAIRMVHHHIGPNPPDTVPPPRPRPTRLPPP